MFPSGRLTVTDPTSKALVHFELVFVSGVRQGCMLNAAASELESASEREGVGALPWSVPHRRGQRTRHQVETLLDYPFLS